MTATVVPDPPPPPPAPAPERTVNGALWVAVIGLGVLQAWPYVAPLIPKPDPFVSLGRSYRADTAVDYAVGWEAWSGALQAGKTADDAKAALQTAWLAERQKSFAAKASPKFSMVLPAGTDPATPAQRAAAVAAGLGFARGLRAK